MSATLASWCLAASLSFVPPDKQPDWPGYTESTEETTARYASVCRDLVEAVGERKDAKGWLALLMAWSFGETGWARDTDEGSPGCYHGPGHAGRCDAHKGIDRAASIFQIHAHTGRDGQPVTVKMLFASRDLAAGIAIRGLISSWTACSKLEPRDRFSQFGIGRCLEGNKSVRARYALYQRVKSWTPAAE